MVKSKLHSDLGKSTPLGASVTKNGVNFALLAAKFPSVTLGIFDSEDGQEPIEIFPLHRRKDIWHVHIQGNLKNFYYGYLIDGEWILDPYAKELNASKIWGKQVEPLLGKIIPQDEFDWKQDEPLNLPFETLRIYEMHVRGFTQDPTSKAKHPGTFLGIIEKIPYLKKLGINAVELLPIFAFDEALNPLINPRSKRRLYNYWGYSTLNYFSPMAPYGTILDFKKMVCALHNAGIEVILDVVYNHVGTNSFSLLSDEVYFILDENGNHANYTGCGNTIHCNHPRVINFILDSLKYWVEEMHVDGFRFDLASIFCRGEKGEVLETPPILEAIENCKALEKTKLIAEPWDCGGIYQVGNFPSKSFAEWNGRYRDVVRQFIKGDENLAGAFATAICGSADLYEHKKPAYSSINFITSHDGFTLYDLVSYNSKHNKQNGENNRDGSDYNCSWNCGVEGETEDQQVLDLRERQMRNFLLALSVSVGTPMFYMGDEYGHTRLGNNNAYCQDNELNYFLWDIAKHQSERLRFFQDMLAMRKQIPMFQRKIFLNKNDITWHGHIPGQPDWSLRFVAYTLHDTAMDIYIAFNADFEGVTVKLPKCARKWKRRCDTALNKQKRHLVSSEYYMHPYSSLILIS